MHFTQDGIEQRLVSIEGLDCKWLLKSNKKFNIVTRDGKVANQMKLTPNSVYAIDNSEGQRFFVFSEAVTDDRITFDKYIFKGDIRLTIGRDRSSDISYDSSVVSSKHAVLEYCDGSWSIQDKDSSNGTFVNEQRIDYKQLKYGDLIYIMGLKIVVGKSFLAINNPDKKVTLTKSLIRFQPQNIVASVEEYEAKKQKFFYRSPRFMRDIETAKFQIEPPPSSPIADEIPMGLALGSSLAMGMMSIVTLTNAIVTNNYMTMAMGGAMLIGTVFLPIITKSYESRRNRKKEAKRQKKYREYLEKVEADIGDECSRQKEILKENIVSVQECEDRIIEQKRNL